MKIEVSCLSNLLLTTLQLQRSSTSIHEALKAPLILIVSGDNKMLGTQLLLPLTIVLFLSVHTASRSISTISDASHDRLFKRNDGVFKLSNRFVSRSVVELRGGEVISHGKKGKKSSLKAAKDLINQVKPVTRLYLALCTFCTLVHIIGLPAPALFGLDRSRLLDIWRPLTAVAYLGGPSMSMANSFYFLVRYGQTLEEEYGTGAHAWFLIVQTALLTILGWLLGFPFQAQAMIAATVYVSSHLNPMEQMPFQFGFMITAWQLPFCMMVIDCLSQQKIEAAWPHVLGIFTGHLYHFYTKIWPALGGKAWLEAPKWIVKKLGAKRASNVAGVDFRKGSEAEGKKGRKKITGKGKKLGGAVKK